MPSDSFEQLLDRAASWFGIGIGFWDIFGHYHATSAAAKQSILRALGVAADSSADLEQALAALARNQWERLLPAAVVAGGAGRGGGANQGGAAAPPRRRSRGGRSDRVAAACGGGTAGRARTFRGAAGGRGKQRNRNQPV